MVDQNNHDDNPASNIDAKGASKSKSMTSKNNMQERLGLGLKNMYRSVLEEPLPDDMLALLDQLDDQDDDDATDEEMGGSGSKRDD